MISFKKKFTLFIGLVIAIIFLQTPSACQANNYYQTSNSLFVVPNITTYLGSTTTQLADVQSNFSSIISGGTINLPVNLNEINLKTLLNLTPEDVAVNLSTSQRDGLNGLITLYNVVVSHPINNTDKSNAQSSISAINTFIGSSSIDTNVGTQTTISAPSTVEALSSTPVAVVGRYTGNTGSDTGAGSDGNMSCYFYVGNGSGTYILNNKANFALSNGNSSECDFSWDVSGTEITTNSDGVRLDRRTLLMMVMPSSWQADKQLTSPSTTTTEGNFATTTVSLVGNTSPDAITVSADNTAITQGATVKITAKVINPVNFPDKQCYIYISDGNGTIHKKTSVDIGGDCSFSWTTSSSTLVGSHTVIANIQGPDLDPGLYTDQPSTTLTLNVCATGATNCKAPDQGGGGGGGNGGGGPTEAFNADISLGSLISQIKNPDLQTVEGIFRFILSLASTLIGVFAFFAVVVGGIQTMTAGGDDAQAAKGKKSILYGVIGMIVAIFAYTLVIIVLGFLRKAGYIN